MVKVERGSMVRGCGEGGSMVRVKHGEEVW